MNLLVVHGLVIEARNIHVVRQAVLDGACQLLNAEVVGRVGSSSCAMPVSILAISAPSGWLCSGISLPMLHRMTLG